MLPGETPRQRYLRRYSDLDVQYANWRTTHEDIIRYLQPGRGRFDYREQENKGLRADELVVNDTGVNSSEKLSAAMDTGITSPAREWFRLTTSDPKANEQPGVREALHEIQDELYQIITGSNAHDGFRAVYRDLVGPATSVLFIEPDDREVLRTIHVPCGQYRLATDARGRVSVVFRRFAMTVRQIVERWGMKPGQDEPDWTNISQDVRERWDHDRRDEWIDVLHVVERRMLRVVGARDKKNKPWASCWLECNAPNDSTVGLLEESGYDEQPFIAPRWDVIGQDAYGRGSPGWQTLGDVRALQILERTGAKMLAKILDPPLSEPDGLRNSSTLPGHRNKTGASGARAEPTVVIPPAAVQVNAEEKRQHERRVERGHFADVLYIISSDQRATPATATEIRAKQDERLLQLGGVFSRFGHEGLSIFIDRALALAQRAGRISKESIDAVLQAGVEIRIDFQNILVAAQKTLGISAVDRLIATAANLHAAGRPEGLKKLDPYEIMDTAADMLGVKPNLLIDDEKLAQMDAAAAQQKQAAVQGQSMIATAPALKQLSETDPQKLQELLARFGPAALAAANGPAQ